MSHPVRMGLTLLLGAVGTAIALSEVVASAQPDPSLANPYRLDESWKLQLPATMKLGRTVAADPGPDGNIYVFHRCGDENCVEGTTPPILKVDPSGKVLKAWGEGLMVLPHGIGFDREGNLWAADAGGPGAGLPNDSTLKRGHQVFKFDLEGKLLMTLGIPGVSGDGPTTLNEPTDVAVGPDGDIYVSDGEGDIGRVVKFTKDGKFVKAWGTRGSGRDNLDQPHAIEIDSRGRVYVADRRNNRVVILDADLQLVTEWRQFGRPSGLFIDRNDMLFVTDSQTTEGRPGWRNGIYIGNIKGEKPTAFIPGGISGKPGGMEGIALDAMGNLFASENSGRAVKKFVKR